MSFLEWAMGMAALLYVAHLYGKNREFKQPHEAAHMFLWEGQLYDRRYFKTELGKVVAKTWWDPTYGTCYNDVSELPEEEQQKLKGRKDV